MQTYKELKIKTTGIRRLERWFFTDKLFKKAHLISPSAQFMLIDDCEAS